MELQLLQQQMHDHANQDDRQRTPAVRAAMAAPRRLGLSDDVLRANSPRSGNTRPQIPTINLSSLRRSGVDPKRY
jgi:hypothetical protein